MNPVKEGQRIPEVAFHQRVNGDLATVTSREVFSGKKVIVFALPGAFTPTCSSTHLPRYEELAEVFRSQGVDEIVCVSVNDAFVMEAWGRDSGAKTVRLLADGNGDFSREMGLLVDKSAIGFGKRSWRYSMFVNNGIIEKLFVEPEKAGDPFEVSDADTMLGYLAPGIKKPAEVTIFTKPGCQFCAEAKRLLTERGHRYEEIELAGKISYATLRSVTGQNTAPQIFIDGEHVRGLDGLKVHFGVK
jgi:glutaredoxin-like protein